jgi:hypothetical protein
VSSAFCLFKNVDILSVFRTPVYFDLYLDQLDFSI